MNKIIRISLVGIMALVFITLYVLVYAQEPQKVTLRYKLNVGNIWKYECVTESESTETAPTQGKSLRNIKENFKYEVQEITPENYYKVKLTTTPTESKGVNIDIKTKEKEEMHDFVAKREYEEIFINLKGEVLTMSADSAVWMCREGGGITETLIVCYEDMMKFLHPIVPEAKVGINDTWNYQVGLVIDVLPGWELIAQEFPTTITYEVIAFEKKDGFDCAKIEYNYEGDVTPEKIIKTLKNKGLKIPEDIEDFRYNSKVKGSGIIYFAHNEGFLVSRKDNLIMTYIQERLIEDKWEVPSNFTARIGFTMNYIKP